MVYQRILNTILCVIQEDLVVYPFYKFTSDPSPLATTSLFSMSVSLRLFHR